MLYEFRSQATGTVVMTADVAEPLLRAMGKVPALSGIITVAQLPEIIAQLELARVRSSTRGPAQIDLASIDPEAEADEPPVSFGARAWPLLDLLQAAHAGGRDVVWGV